MCVITFVYVRYIRDPWLLIKRDELSSNFLVNKTNRRTEFHFYWYYDSTCFGQPFCPSSGVLSRISAVVFLCSCDRLLPEIGWNCMYSVLILLINTI